MLTLVGKVMELAVEKLSMSVHKRVCVDAVAMHLPVAFWNPSVGKHHKRCMDGLGSQRNEVPEHIIVWSDVSPWVSKMHL